MEKCIFFCFFEGTVTAPKNFVPAGACATTNAQKCRFAQYTNLTLACLYPPPQIFFGAVMENVQKNKTMNTTFVTMSYSWFFPLYKSFALYITYPS